MNRSDLIPIPLTIVSGFGRCGTSLMMRILEIGGIPPIDGRRNARYEIQDTGKAPLIKENEKFFMGKAVKYPYPTILQLDKYKCPATVLWMTRNRVEQVKSVKKWQKDVRGGGGLIDIDMPSGELIELWDKQEVDTLQYLNKLNKIRTEIIPFEVLINTPKHVAKFLVRLLDIPKARLSKMSKEVRSRSTDCLPYILEDELDSSFDGRIGVRHKSREGNFEKYLGFKNRQKKLKEIGSKK